MHASTIDSDRGLLGVGGGGKFFSASGRALSASSCGVSTEPFATSGNLNSDDCTAFFTLAAALLGSGGCRYQHCQQQLLTALCIAWKSTVTEMHGHSYLHDQ